MAHFPLLVLINSTARSTWHKTGWHNARQVFLVQVNICINFNREPGFLNVATFPNQQRKKFFPAKCLAACIQHAAFRVRYTGFVIVQLFSQLTSYFSVYWRLETNVRGRTSLYFKQVEFFNATKVRRLTDMFIYEVGTFLFSVILELFSVGFLGYRFWVSAACNLNV